MFPLPLCNPLLRPSAKCNLTELRVAGCSADLMMVLDGLAKGSVPLGCLDMSRHDVPDEAGLLLSAVVAQTGGKEG